MRLRTENRQITVDPAYDYDSGFYSIPLALYHKDKQLTVLGVGNEDDIYLFRNGNNTLIYAANDRLDYMSLIEFDPDHGIVNEIFLDCDSFNEFKHLQPINRSKAMYQWF